MLNIPASALAQTGRCLLALTLTLGGGAARTPAPAAPLTAAAPAPGPAVYYLDGKLSDKTTVDGLDPKSIAYMNVLSEEEARKAFGAASGTVAIIVTTANQNSAAVLALNKKVGPLISATPAQNAAIAAGQAYIAKTYPNAKLHFIGPDHKADPAAPRYHAEIEDGGQVKQLHLDDKGQPVQ
ncbi:hypothetical protein [Hymenobacter terricola]|uniref:hypothetical protein n=1 Tax=Hymenobacter terricola TaxID=2819236 RepID=UPI001B30096F|nr:hypothetical protein [Hymenobacter terricola]